MLPQLMHDPKVMALDRFPVSTAATFRSPVFLPWGRATEVMLREYKATYRPWRKVEVNGRSGSVIESIEIDSPLWRRHKNFLNILFSNLIPIPDENDSHQFVFTASWIAGQLGYEQPDKRANEIDQIIYQLQKTQFRFRFKNRPGELTTGIFDETERINALDIQKYDLPTAALGMRRVTIKKKWMELFAFDHQVVMMPETSSAIASIPDGAWQSLVEVALSHKDFFNQRLETSKDGATIGAIAMIGFNKALMSKSAYSKQRKNLITSSESSELAARVAGVVIEEGSEGYVVRRIDQHNKIGQIFVSGQALARQ